LSEPYDSAHLSRTFLAILALVIAGVVAGVSSADGSPLPPPLPGGFPDSSTTGYDSAPGYPGSLTPAGQPGCELPIVSNKTYRFCAFNAGLSVGSASAKVSNVTFYGCRFKGVAVEQAMVILYGTTGANGNGITFDYSSFEPGVAAPPTPYSQSYQYGIAAAGSYHSSVQKLVVTHSDFWGFGNAIDVTGSTQANPHIFRHNYIHDAAQDGGSYHTDGIGDTTGSGRGSYVVIDHNTIVSNGNTNGIAFQQGSYDHFTVTNNLFSGFGYTIAIWAPAPYTIFTDNTYSTILRPYYGPLYPQSFWTSTGSVWARNRWSVPSGAAWGNPLHDGWFWVPNTSMVSQTDYQG
jgi:Right handed beta helix region